jgi:hypothetical protein
MDAKTINQLLDQPFHLLIGGELQPGSDQFESVNPAAEQVISEVPAASSEQIDQAVAAANLAQPSWAALTMGERQTILSRVAEILRANSEAWGMLDGHRKWQCVLSDAQRCGRWRLDARLLLFDR